MWKLLTYFDMWSFTCAKYQVYDYLKRVDIEKHAATYVRYRDSELLSHVEEEVIYRKFAGSMPFCNSHFHIGITSIVFPFMVSCSSVSFVMINNF